jgi:cell division protein FtsQ
MARKSSPTISQEDLYPADESLRPSLDDTRLVDLDREEESPFLRAQKRVSVRRGALPKKAANRIKWLILAIILVAIVSAACGAIYRYSEQSWRFRIDSSDDIQVLGTHNVSHTQVLDIFGSDIGRNIFFVPLSQRKTQLEQIPWVESASVMRFVPNRLKVEIHERTPVAFVRVGSRIALIDAGGTVMELPAVNRKKYSFPVIVGANPGEPLSTRAARMKICNELFHELDSGGARYSQDLSEVDLSDPDDVKVVANDPQGAVLVHLGSSNFLARYKVYVSHLQEWRQQFDKVDSVDLRYDRQIIVNPDLRGLKETPLSASAARVATAAGVKPAALITKFSSTSRPKIVPVRPSAQNSLHAAQNATRWQKYRRGGKRNSSKIAKLGTSAAPPVTAKGAPRARTGAKDESSGSKLGKKPSPALAKEQGTD